jgi:hypothetical protein
VRKWWSESLNFTAKLRNSLFLVAEKTWSFVGKMKRKFQTFFLFSYI